MEFIKRIFWGQPEHAQVAQPSTAEHATLDELVQANIELGREIDALRERRRLLKARIDALHAERDKGNR